MGVKRTTFASKANITEQDVANDGDAFDLCCGEEVEAMRIVLLLVHLQDPTIRITLDTGMGIESDDVL